jgi:hypothetical protein
MYVEKLEMKNVRCFESTSLCPRFPGLKDDADIEFENVSLLLGNNGAGKSSTLRSLAMGVLSRVLEVSEYQPYSVVRKGAKPGVATVRATICLGPLDRPPNRYPKGKPLVLTTRITREGDYERLGVQDGPYLPDLFVDLTPTFFLVGYGATRRMDSDGRGAVQERKTGGLRFVRVSSLFYDFVALTPLTAWMPQLASEEPRRFQEIIRLVNKLLPDELRFKGEQESRVSRAKFISSKADRTRDYVFMLDGQPLSFGALSDGYRAYIAWIADLLYHLYQCTPKRKPLTDLTGLVLVDEVDLHLHPSWQREVMKTISAALPNLQFVCTSHSPIVAGTLKREQVFVMDRNERGSVEIKQLDERIHGLNADQILTSSYFGLTTTRAPDFVDELRELRRKAWRGDGSATLQFLKRMAGPAEEAGNSGSVASNGAKPLKSVATRKVRRRVGK